MKIEKVTPVVNTGSLADVAFLLLIFFLVTTTIQTDVGLPTLLPPWVEEEIICKVYRENVFSIQINGDGDLLLQGRASSASAIEDELRHHLQVVATFPQKVVVELQNSSQTSYKQYVQVHSALQTTYKHLWEETAQQQYGRPYEDLTPEVRKGIRAIYPLVLTERQIEVAQ